MADIPLPQTSTPNLTQYYTDPVLEKTRTDAATATTTANQYTAAGSLLPYKLKDAILQKLNYNNDLLKPTGTAAANYFAAPAEARVKYQNIWDPQQREALVTRDRADKFGVWDTLKSILETRMGGISDLIGAGSAALKSEETMAGSNADRQNKQYNDLLNRATLLTGATKDQANMSNTEAWQRYNALTAASNFVEQMAMQQKQLDASSNSGLDSGSLAEIAKMFGLSNSDWEVVG